MLASKALRCTRWAYILKLFTDPLNAYLIQRLIIHDNITVMIKKIIIFRYCQEFFTEEFNRNGACEFAPDCFKASLEYTTAMKCARCMLYHCMSDSEGEMPQHPCECVPEENICSKRYVRNDMNVEPKQQYSYFDCFFPLQIFRWIGLFLLSMIFPCLCFYPACHGVHKIGISCGVCGGKHQPQM